MSVAISIGHRKSSQGARMVTTGETEWSFNTRLAYLIQSILTANHVPSIVFYRPDHRAGIYTLCDAINEAGHDLAVELHFNSFSNQTAHGSEVLYHYMSSRGNHLASVIQNCMVAATGLADRGLRPRRPKTRGWPYLSSTAMPAVIVEPFFGSNPDDCGRVSACFDDLAAAIAEAIVMVH